MKTPDNFKNLRNAVLTVVDNFQEVYCYGKSKASKKKSLVSVGVNHYRQDGICFVLGVDNNMSEEQRSSVWLSAGIKIVEKLESLGFKVDREKFSTNRDGRAFFVNI